MAGIRREFLAVGGYGTNAHPSETQLEADSSTYKKGAPLIYNGAGRLAEGGVDAVDLVGTVEQDGQNGTSKTARFSPATSHVIFEGQIDDTTLNGSYAQVATSLGLKYGITKEAASGKWYLDTTKTDARVRVLVVGLKDAAAALYPRVYFTFLRATTIY